MHGWKVQYTTAHMSHGLAALKCHTTLLKHIKKFYLRFSKKPKEMQNYEVKLKHLSWLYFIITRIIFGEFFCPRFILEYWP